MPTFVFEASATGKIAKTVTVVEVSAENKEEALVALRAKVKSSRALTRDLDNGAFKLKYINHTDGLTEEHRMCGRRIINMDKNKTITFACSYRGEVVATLCEAEDAGSDVRITPYAIILTDGMLDELVTIGGEHVKE
jgi:hypothetical protein